MKSIGTPSDVHSDDQSLQASSIGAILSEVLDTDQEGSVLGKTSRGVFVRTQTRWLAYLSFKSYRNPLALNLTALDSSTLTILPSLKVYIKDRQISIPRARIFVSTKNSTLWEPKPPVNSILSRSARQTRLSLFVETSVEVNNRQEFINLLQLFAGKATPHAGIRELSFSQGNLTKLHEDLKFGNAPLLIKTLTNIMGTGQGLTPAGDDFIIGFLLSVNRWKHVLWVGNGLGQLNKAIVKTAYQKTTTLSANLIECASLGLGDERIINAVDCLVSKIPFDPKPVNELLGWGNSSGAYALAGMAMAFNSSQ